MKYLKCYDRLTNKYYQVEIDNATASMAPLDKEISEAPFKNIEIRSISPTQQKASF